MRSRYSAYVKHAINYLVGTTHPSSRDGSLLANITSTADTYSWLSLQVANIQGGTAEDNIGKVEFLAHYRSRDGQIGIHHERSRFKKYAGKWMYLDGELM